MNLAQIVCIRTHDGLKLTLMTPQKTVAVYRGSALFILPLFAWFLLKLRIQRI